MPDGDSNQDKKPVRFRLYSDEEMEQHDPPEWLIQGILPSGGFAVLYGDAGTGKSFLALGWSLAVGKKHPWFERAVKQGPVVYIAAEGSHAIGLRIRAWKEKEGVESGTNVHFLPEPVQMMDEPDVTDFLAAITQQLAEKPVLIVIDTMARCLVDADENSAKDVGRFINGLDQIRKKTRATTLVVHHSAKKSPYERGSSALRAAADTMMSLSKKEGVITLECDKQKDAEEFDAMAMELSPVQLDDGASSCVLERTDIIILKEGLTERVKIVLTTLHNFGDEGAYAKKWLRATGMAEKTFYRARDVLAKHGYVHRPEGKVRGSPYYLTEKGKEAVTVA